MSENTKTNMVISEKFDEIKEQGIDFIFKPLYPEIKFKKIHEDAILPTKKDGDACFDLYSVTTESLMPGKRFLYKTGLTMEMPLFIEATIRPRSGMAIRDGITVLNTPGTIDSTYRGEIGIELINHGDCVFHISAGDRIAQMRFGIVMNVTFTEVKELGETERGEGGFGSTGK